MNLQTSDLNFERAVLSHLVHDNRSVEKLGIGIDFFTSPTHREIWNAHLRLQAAGHLTTAESIAVEVPSISEFELFDILDAPTGDIGFYVDKLREFFARRQLLRLAPEISDALQDGGSARGLEAAKRIISTIEPSTTTAKAAFRLSTIAELSIEPIDFLVADLIPANSLGVLFGETGHMKSFVIIDAACCIASGHDFHGHKTKQGSVVYVAGEGSMGLGRRFHAWAIRHDCAINDLPVYVSTTPIELLDDGSVDGMIGVIERTIGDEVKPELIVLDTLARNFGGDENSTADMSAAVRACDRIRERFECALVLVHHVGQAVKDRARGSIALKAALDVEYRVERNESGIVTLTCTKSKDAPEPAPMAFTAHEVDLGIIDDAGRPVTSLVLNSTAYAPPEKTKQVGLGKNQKIMLGILKSETERCRENLRSANFDPEGAAVAVRAWEEKSREAGIPAKRIGEARESLLRSGLIIIEGPNVRPISDPSAVSLYKGKTVVSDMIQDSETAVSDTFRTFRHPPKGAVARPEMAPSGGPK